MSNEWNLLITGETDPIFNMAVEDAIASRVGKGVVPPTLRIWKDKSCFVIGRFGHRRFVEQIKRVKREGFLVVEKRSITMKGVLISLFSFLVPTMNKIGTG